jgi:Divergent InlB B-repeat domain
MRTAYLARISVLALVAVLALSAMPAAVHAQSVAGCPVPPCVTFTETGLPIGTHWSVAFSGASPALTDASGKTWSYGTAIVFWNIANGTYTFTADNVTCSSSCAYVPSPSSGTLNTATSRTQTIQFQEVAVQSSAVQVVVSAGQGGTVAKSGTLNVAPGSTLPLLATPNAGMQFSRWETTGTITIDDPTSPSATATITGAGAITAIFSVANSTSNTGTNTTTGNTGPANSGTGTTGPSYFGLDSLTIALIAAASIGVVVPAFVVGRSSEIGRKIKAFGIYSVIFWSVFIAFGVAGDSILQSSFLLNISFAVILLSLAIVVLYRSIRAATGVWRGFGGGPFGFVVALLVYPLVSPIFTLLFWRHYRRGDYPPGGVGPIKLPKSKLTKPLGTENQTDDEFLDEFEKKGDGDE